MPQHALTIDVEDWYQVENFRLVAPPERWNELPSRLERNMERLLGLFEEKGARATFFVLGRAAERHPVVVKDILAAGHEVACHGWEHDLVYRQTPDVFREETRRAKSLLEDLGGARVEGYRASTFSITDRSLWALDILAEEGFVYDSSIAPLRHDRYGIPSAPRDPHLRELKNGRTILEYPLSTMRALGATFPLGGGFFRLFPMRWIERALKEHEARSQSAIVYMHPWEIDPDQPRMEGVGWLRRFRHYARLGATELKLRRLLDRFAFTTAREILRARFKADGAVKR